MSFILMVIMDSRLILLLGEARTSDGGEGENMLREGPWIPEGDIILAYHVRKKFLKVLLLSGQQLSSFL